MSYFKIHIVIPRVTTKKTIKKFIVKKKKRFNSTLEKKTYNKKGINGGREGQKGHVHTAK